MHIFKRIHNDDISLEDIEKEQIKFKRNLAQIKQGNPKNRSKEQQKTINNATNLYNLRQEVVKMFNDYAKNMSKNIYESQHKEQSYAEPSYTGPPYTGPSYTGPSYTGPPYTGPSYTGPPYTESTKPPKTESTKPPETHKDDDSNDLINELKKLGVSTENLIDFDSPMDLLTNLHSGITTMEEVEKEQDKYESLLDELNKIDKDNISKK